MCNTENTYQPASGFASLGRPRKIWTVPAIHGDIDALTALHDALYQRFQPGDSIVYHGNYTGYGAASVQCIDEILTFRRMVLSIPGVLARDFVYLKGGQEEIWSKLAQLPFAPDPTSVLLWMLGHGLSATLQSYGLCAHDGIDACRYGVMGLTKWTAKVRTAQRRHAGHEVFHNQLRCAAFTDDRGDYPMLFVHSGLNAQKPLYTQRDELWWAGDAFDAIDQAYRPFEKVVRGYDPQHRGLYLNCITATVDDGCGFGGQLISVGLHQDGSVAEILEA